MSNLLCISVHFLQPLYHARNEHGDPEWPPSPMRLFQAMVAAAAARWNERESIITAADALRWFESLNPPAIHCGIGKPAAQSYRLYVPDNIGDKVAATWSRGGTASIADYRTEKDVHSTTLDSPSVEFLYDLSGFTPEIEMHVGVIRKCVRSITHVGWGIDMVAADATIISSCPDVSLGRERWIPTKSGKSFYRSARSGSLNQLNGRHRAFLNRIEQNDDGSETLIPVPPLSIFNVLSYRNSQVHAGQPFVVFELRRDDDSRFSYAQEKLIHLAGMVRHLAIASMTNSPPVGVSNDWVETYVAGHSKLGDKSHRQLSYLPLPSIGHIHTNPSVRRVMIAAPLGDDRLLNHVARHLAGRRLTPTEKTKLSDPPALVQMHGDKVTECYTKAANIWASVTPVILPGHDDHKPEKTQRLILKALQQSGVDQPCEFKWSAISYFPKALSAHKYDREKRPIGYIRPDHLLNLTAVHLLLKFECTVSGPLAIGAGRHCGLGIFARAE